MSDEKIDLFRSPGILCGMKRAIAPTRLWVQRAMCAFAIIFCGIVAAAAQAPATVDPESPVLNSVAPPGGRRGSTLDLKLTGTNLGEPIAVWTSFHAKASIQSENTSGTPPKGGTTNKGRTKNGDVRVRLEIPKDAPLGFHWIRLATSRGVSNFRLFCVDDLPEVSSPNINHSPLAALSAATPSVITGKISAEESDYYRIHVAGGQRINFEIIGRRLGSPLDPLLTLRDGRTGRALPSGHSNDSPGLQGDPRIHYFFKEPAEILIEVTDAIHRGGPDFWYRLRIGDFPCAVAPIPMAARRGSQVSVQFAGPSVEGAESVEVAVPEERNLNALAIAPRRATGPYGWPVTLALSDFEESVEVEPNDDPAHANPILVPGGMTGRFEHAGDIDCYKIKLSKGQKIVIEAQTHELNSPAEVYMVLKDKKGAPLTSTNPMGPPQLEFTAPANDEYILAVENLLHEGGPSECYHLVVRPNDPSFSLSLREGQLQVPQGGIAPVEVVATRQGYSGPIDVQVEGSREITGRMILHAADSVDPKQPAKPLFIYAAADALIGASTFSIVGSAVIDGRRVERIASLHSVVSQNLNGLPNHPPGLDRQIGLCITERSQFSLLLWNGADARTDTAIEVTKGMTISLGIKAVRATGFNEEISISAAYLPPNVKLIPTKIGKDQTIAEVRVQIEANATPGAFPLGLTGTSKFKNHLVRSTTAPVTVKIIEPTKK